MDAFTKADSFATAGSESATKKVIRKVPGSES
jgi:hypothetical protein